MLLRLGARVPAVSKWAPNYYFKHEATAAFLLDNGMDPNHMNWHRSTLLHHMAAAGELGKAKLLLAHGADIDSVDDEYRSTPLGVAARCGQQAMSSRALINHLPGRRGRLRSRGPRGGGMSRLLCCCGRRGKC